SRQDLSRASHLDPFSRNSRWNWFVVYRQKSFRRRRIDRHWCACTRHGVYLMGSPRPTSISAKVFRNFAHLVNVPIFDVEDEAHAFIRFANGAIVELETSWAANLTDDTPVGPEWVGRESNNCVLFGTRGTLRLKPLTLFEDDN